jgi:hypothetical protein
LLLSERLVPGEWTRLIPMPAGEDTRYILSGRSGVTTRAGGGVVDSAPPLLHELGDSALVRSFLPSAWPASSWRRRFDNYFSARLGSIIATAGYASHEVRLRDWETGEEWSRTLSAPWLRPIAWPARDGYGEGPLGTQMTRWAQEQALVSGILGHDRSFVALVRLHSPGGEPQWGYIVGDAREGRLVATVPSELKVLHLSGGLAFVLAELEDGDIMLETRRIRIPGTAR